MKNVARMALENGMVIGEDIYSYQNELLYPKDTVVTQKVIARLARHSIICVAIKEEIDYATTHFEKVRLSSEFKYFEFTYNDCMPVYEKLMTDFVEKGVPVRMNKLMELYVKITSCARSGEQLLDFLYNMLPREDAMTHAHCLNSALIAGVFGTWWRLSKEDIFLLIQCGFLYDIGKLKLPQELLWKPDKLTELEYTKLKTHTMLGFDLLKDQHVNEHVIKATLMHHERCDGSGYPSRLQIDKIDIFARYIAVIDAYEAMTSARTYRQSLNPFQVIENFEKDGYVKFDEAILRPILYHIASTQLTFNVRLSNDVEAKIMEINKAALSRPLLQTEDGTQIDLSLQPALKIVAIY
ncbi:MAG: HD domain-containing protein [Lachnospiraceae bacterium]|jgi:HD-GYP domain-containing protein (c-di-GMP phosphodiesterase class II)|nr:HD domain-containing protein [Lachnospiraceae bacterium]